MDMDLSRRALLKAAAAVAATALFPVFLNAKPALDLEAFFDESPMGQVLGGAEARSCLSAGMPFVPNIFTADCRFNITQPLRHALAQILTDGKDIIFAVDEPDRDAHYRDAAIIHLFRRLGVPSFTNYGEVDFQPAGHRPIIGVYGALADQSGQKAMLLTMEEKSWKLVDATKQALPLFESCVLV